MRWRSPRWGARPSTLARISLAVIILIVAVVGGIAVHPLLFAIALLALILFLFNGRGGRTVA
jgi:hypothetical protein